MILYVKGSLLQSPAQVLVNTVNTVGVMGKGIALEFKNLFPDMYRQYRDLCESGQFSVGQLWLYKSANKWVLNFPTKKHWRSPSQVEYIEAGLRKFTSSYADLGIHSIAFPALGCGNGQLDFETQVKPVLEKHLRQLPIEVFIYPGRDSVFTEHLRQVEMKQWLRSEPTSLPFSEVWEDLAELLDRKTDFVTTARKNPFSAGIVDDPPGIRVVASMQTYFIDYDTLMAFWQQLRTHGFSTRNIAPGIDRQMSYLIPIFAELAYVTPVHVADDFDDLKYAAVTGLQLLPSIAARTHPSYEQTQQLSLFSGNEVICMP